MLKRDEAQAGLVSKEDHEPSKAGSWYLPVNDLEALRRELELKGGDIGRIHVQEWSGNKYRVFFLREDDNGYCFCFGRPA